MLVVLLVELLLLLLRGVPDHVLEVGVLLGQLLHHVLQALTDLALRSEDPLPPTTVALTVLQREYVQCCDQFEHKEGAS